MTRLHRALTVCALAALASACGTVRSTRLRPDYDAVDRHQTKRLVVATHPLPDGKEKVGEMWSLMARRYVNLKRQYIVKQSLASADPTFQPQHACGEGLDGVLWLEPKLQRRGGGFEAEVTAQLLRCSDGEEVWAAEAGGSWRSDDETLRSTVQQYVAELGPEVEPYVAPSFQLLRATLDTMPDVVLTEEDEEEKLLAE